MAQNINRVTLTGNLTRDPELRTVSSGLSICNMRVAVNGRIKQQGEWVDKANYFDVVAFGAQGENCNRYLAKGRMVAVDGRLDWREWTTDSGDKRQAVQVIAESVQFLGDGSGERDSSSSSGSGGFASAAPPPPASGLPADDDIPFLREESPFEWEPRRA